MFVIPCKYNPIVHDCVNAIREHHPDARILVVDSASDDRSYLGALDCDTADIENRHYGPGAFAYAVESNPDEDFFYLLFDSLIVRDNLDDLREHDLTTVRWFDSATTGWGWDEHGNPLDMWAHNRGVNIPSRFKGVMGPMIAASREVIEKADLFRVLPTTKYEQCALERCWGIWLQAAGYDPAHSLQGEMRGFFDPYPNERVEKVTFARD